jgi:ribosome-binding factor A
MELVMRGRLKDPATKNMIVCAVDVTADLQIAKVYVRTLEEASDRRKASLVAGLERASGFLRRELGKRLELRRTPELRFAWDESIDQGARIEALLDEIREEEDEEGPDA